MNLRPPVMNPAGSSRLAEELDFNLGELNISPSGLEISAGDKRKTVQPRVMQVLVALARAEGTVVSRDELIRQCWAGRIVSDDSINRCIVKIRQLAELGGKAAFEIETVPRVGYRLRRTGESATDARAADIGAARPGPLKRAGLIAGLVAICAAAALGLWNLWPKPAAQWKVTGSRLLIATSLIERYPAISPDGKTIAYSAGTDIEGRKIYLHNISGGDPLRLTNDDYDDTSPSWCPDGGQIAYVAYKQGEPCRLMIMPVPAGLSREVGRCRSDERSTVVWLPSGKSLFFLDRPNAKSIDRIMLFDLGSGRTSAVTHPSEGTLGDGEPLLSPDGQWLAFSRTRDSLTRQWIVLGLKTRSAHVLIRQITGDYAGWSPDAKTLFANSDVGTDHAIWAYPLDGGPPSRILSSPEETGRMSAGPNGLLAVELHTVNVGLARTSATGSGEATYLEFEKGFAGTPDIAPGGTLVAAIYRPEDLAIWVLPKNGPLRKLIALPDVPNVEVAGEPRWSPDGSRIAFGTVPGENAIRVITSSGASVAAISFHGIEIGTPAWTADGSALVFPGRDQKGWRLWRVELAHPEMLQVTSYSGWLTIHFRGNELFGVRYDVPGVWRIDSVSRRITGKPSPEHSNEWAIAGDDIVYVDDPFGKHRQLMAQPISGGPARVLAQVPNYAAGNGFAIDTTGGTVVYTATLNSDSDIELLHLAYQ